MSFRLIVTRSIIINDLKKTSPPGCPILCIFCEKENEDQTVENLAASLLNQLVSYDLLAAAAQCKALFQEHKVKQTHPSVDELFSGLEKILSSQPACYIVLDAFDEKEVHAKKIIQFLQERLKSVQLLVTSRYKPDHCFLSASLCIIKARSEDIGKYLADTITSHSSYSLPNNEELWHKVITKIQTQADGM